MPTSAAGNKTSRFARLPVRLHSAGFTLLELLVVVSLIAILTTVATLSLRVSGTNALQQDAERLASLLESARHRSRASGVAVSWQTDLNGFRFEGLSAQALPRHWLQPDTRSRTPGPIVLGPEPLIGQQAIALFNARQPEAGTWWIVTDGLRPFQAQATAQVQP